MRKNVFKSLGKAVFWFFFLLLVGLLQLSIAFLYSLVFAKGVFNLEAFFIDGFFLFFCISTVCSISYEYFLENDHNGNKYSNFVIVLVVCSVVLFSMWMYTTMFANKNLDLSKRNPNFFITQMVILIVSCLLTFGLKTVIYYNQYIKELRRGNL